MVAARNFNYEVEIDKGDPEWVPTQVFDDGRQTFIRFPAGMLVREAPELFVLGPPLAELVNYRVKGNLYVVDRLFTAATLRLGQQDQEAVNIFRLR